MSLAASCGRGYQSFDGRGASMRDGRIRGLKTHVVGERWGADFGGAGFGFSLGGAGSGKGA